MSVGTTDCKISYSCSIGGPQSFTFPYPFIEDSDLSVVVDGGWYGAVTTLLLGADYTVAPLYGSYFNGGTITFTEDKWSGTVTILRDVPLLQETDYQDYSNFPADVFERDLDKLVMMVQQLSFRIDRCIHEPDSDEDTINMELPSMQDRRNLWLGFDDDGDVLVGAPLEGTISVSSFWISMLQSVDRSESLLNLGLKTEPYIIAAYDAPWEWQDRADYVMMNGECLPELLDDLLVNDSVSDILLSPGQFTYDHSLDVDSSSNFDIHIRGQGKGKTYIRPLGNSFVAFLRVFDSYTQMLTLEDFTINWADDDATGVGTGVIAGITSMAQNTTTIRRVNVELDNLVATAAATQRGFQNLGNLTDCHVSIVNMADNDITFEAFDNCVNLYGCSVNYASNAALTGSNRGFVDCTRLSSCLVETTSLSTTGVIMCFQSCRLLSDCKANSDGSGTTGCYGFSSCQEVSSCYAGSVKGSGFNACYQISACFAQSVGWYGFEDCDVVASCTAKQATGIGFDGCRFISACKAESCGGDGFFACFHISSCEAVSNTGDGYDTCAHTVNCHAITNTGYGIKGCTWTHSCYAVSNTAGQYNTSYADTSSNACGVTAAGGYNQ